MILDIAEDGENNESYPASVLQKNPLLSSAAQSVIEMGYLPRIVKRAVDNIIKEHGNYYIEWASVLIRQENKLKMA